MTGDPTSPPLAHDQDGHVVPSLESVQDVESQGAQRPSRCRAADRGVQRGRFKLLDTDLGSDQSWILKLR